ncbi:hypothetical protein N7492_004026 [Penicillium capsulatum]|uniref:Uncharacterized protein n=1 Tax=Penicillium capsulatum TaxID=69766 RepID=A0A9W9IP48_9EURO|nr:hypothetical protein N7492_004026 [Penicillium capsulatum]KAJ6121399.1 hypothetical protein N7512_003864 [Penicillium capsulatum]
MSLNERSVGFGRGDGRRGPETRRKRPAHDLDPAGPTNHTRIRPPPPCAPDSCGSRDGLHLGSALPCLPAIRPTPQAYPRAIVRYNRGEDWHLLWVALGTVIPLSLNLARFWIRLGGDLSSLLSRLRSQLVYPLPWFTSGLHFALQTTVHNPDSILHLGPLRPTGVQIHPTHPVLPRIGSWAIHFTRETP